MLRVALTAVASLAILFAGAAADIRSAGIDIRPLSVVRMLIVVPSPTAAPVQRRTIDDIMAELLH
jgi:hypothetical protein